MAGIPRELAVHAHEAVLDVEDDGGAAAPGASITVELCGHWQHEGSCRWPHSTSVVSLVDRVLTVRVLYAACPPDLPEVRARIAAGLDRGELAGPDGRLHRWRVRRAGASQLLESEAAVVRALLGLDAGG
jgi:hypothetical protein